MRVAVFTGRYPIRTASFFERDMRALRAAGIELDIFPVGPEDKSLWRYAQGLVEDGMTLDHIHRLGIGESLLRGGALLSGSVGAIRDAAAVMLSAMRFGPIEAAKTAYALPKAWAWAAQGAAGYDHVFAYWGNYAGTCAYLFHRLAGGGVPFTIWLHAGVDLYRNPVFMVPKLRYADNIITCCEFNRDFINRTFAASVEGLASKVHVSHHGLDLREFTFQPGNRPPATILAVGRLVPHKGYENLLKATAILAQRDVKVTVEFVGDGEERRNLMRLTAQLGIGDRVSFRGWVKGPEVRKAMLASTVLVHPSPDLGDGLPNVLREAMAVGTPVIASSVAGIPDALKDDCGVLIPPKDPVALADAITALLANPNEQRRLAERARRRVEQHYNMWSNGARLAQLLRSTHRAGTNAEMAA